MGSKISRNLFSFTFPPLIIFLLVRFPMCPLDRVQLILQLLLSRFFLEGKIFLFLNTILFPPHLRFQ